MTTGNPRPELESLLTGNDSILARKTLVIAGVQLSLNDIQFNILRQNYANNLLLIYGMYQGVIGGPNIRKNAYTGKGVYADLNENALEFINSNRGTESRNSGVFRVAGLQARNATYLPDFDADLTRHLLTQLEGDERAGLQKANRINPDIEDWTVTDMYGSSGNLSGSIANNAAALDGAIAGNSSEKLTTKSVLPSRYSQEKIQQLNKLNQKREEQKAGTVTVEELGDAPEATTPVDQDDKGRD